MDYKKYIVDLGFVRTEMNDGVEFDQTGYHGFALERKVNDRISVCVTSRDLDKPKLYIKKNNSGHECHIILISCEAVVDMFTNLKV
jgi:hypothetical protein